ncbi:hypothetical protein DFR50_110126 [Roseiarcus fermentans]|uniref:Uncharacterized protein n=2 Tax=Roseiarcus fermentans TaxID=1473586 RepID=A0A366FHM4_9HYPH|nr:hypothetical protein DFR50_110126 [Roseiarcus fermentans]
MDELSSQGFSDVEASFGPDRVRVAVNAPFGEGQRAAQILDRHGPMASGEADAGAGSPTAAPAFDCAKIKDSAAPLSEFFGWSVLNDARSPFWPEALVDDPTPLSTRMGWSVLELVKEGADSKIKDPATPLSDLLGWRVLSDYKSPFWPEALIDDPTPLSKRFGWPVLLGPSSGAGRSQPVAAAPQDARPVEAPGVEAVQAPAAEEPSREEAVEAPAGEEPIREEAVAAPAPGAPSREEEEPPRAGQTKERKRGRRPARPNKS